MAIKPRIDEEAIKNIEYLIKMERYKEAGEFGEYLLDRHPHLDELGIALCLQLLDIYIVLNDGKSFKRLFNHYENILKEHTNPFIRTKMNLLLGHYYLHIGHDYEECLQYYQKSISLAFQYQYHLQLVVAINNMTAAFEKRHVPIQTIYQFLKFNMIVAEKIEDQNSNSYVEGHLMYFRIMTMLRKFDNVKRKIALFLEKDLNNMTRVRVLHALQYCQYTAGEYIQSLETSKKALIILEQDSALKGYVAGYENIYKTMKLAAKAMNLPVYKAYEQQYEHYRRLGEVKKQINKKVSAEIHVNMPHFLKAKDFYAEVESATGTFILIQHADAGSILPVVKDQYPLSWTCLTNSIGIFIPQLLTEQEVEALLVPVVDAKQYSFCHSGEDDITGRDYYYLLQAQVYYKERT